MESHLKELINNFVAELQLLRTGSHTVRQPEFHNNEAKFYISDSIPYSIIDLLNLLVKRNPRIMIHLISDAFPVNLEILDETKFLKKVSVVSNETEFPNSISIPNQVTTIRFTLNSSISKPVTLNFVNGESLKWLELKVNFPCRINLDSKLKSLGYIHVKGTENNNPIMSFGVRTNRFGLAVPNEENENIEIFPAKENNIRTLVYEKAQLRGKELSKFEKLRKICVKGGIFRNLNNAIACRELLAIEVINSRVMDEISPKIWDLPKLRYLDLNNSVSENWKMKKIDTERIILGIDVINFRYRYYDNVHRDYFFQNLFGEGKRTLNGSDYKITFQPPNLRIEYYKQLPEALRNRFQGIDSLGIKYANIYLKGDINELKKLHNLGVNEVSITIEKSIERNIIIPFLPKTQVLHLITNTSLSEVYIDAPELPNLRMIEFSTSLENIRVSESLVSNENLVLKTTDSFVFTRLKNHKLVQLTEYEGIRERYYLVQRTE